MDTKFFWEVNVDIDESFEIQENENLFEIAEYFSLKILKILDELKFWEQKLWILVYSLSWIYNYIKEEFHDNEKDIWKIHKFFQEDINISKPNKQVLEFILQHMIYQNNVLLLEWVDQVDHMHAKNTIMNLQLIPESN